MRVWWIFILTQLVLSLTGDEAIIMMGPRETSFVSIRSTVGGSKESLPTSLCRTWGTWTYWANEGRLDRVPDSSSDNDEMGWVNPSSFDELYLPKDLPLPLIQVRMKSLLTCIE